MPSSATRTAVTAEAPFSNSSRRMVLIPAVSSSPKAETPAVQPVTVTGLSTSPLAALAATPMVRTARPPDTTEDVSYTE